MQGAGGEGKIAIERTDVEIEVAEALGDPVGRRAPLEISLVTTSAKLTLPITASGSARRTRSKPGSRCRKASSAEASRTTSATLRLLISLQLARRLLAPFPDQLIGK